MTASSGLRLAAAAARPFLTAAWRHLVILTWEVDPRVLAPLVPAGTALDRWRGRALVSLVGFRFLDTRVLGAAVPFHRDFDEVNLRFYVRRDLPGGLARRGVVFVRELVPRVAVALVARLAYNEPYRVVPMRSDVPAAALRTPARLTYAWRLGGRWQRLAATREGAPAVPAPGGEAAFVAEPRWGYTRQRDGGTVEYRVERPPWRVWAGSEAVLDADVGALCGPTFVWALSAPPTSVLIAEGSAVSVSAPHRLGRALRERPPGLGAARGADRHPRGGAR